jgi:RNA polymerase sigma factor (sigma-70 family)
MADDPELLLRYVRDHSEPAFRELVERHLALVYFAALRQVGGDAHRAEDVSQVVFTQLALKAANLAGRDSIAGWLYTCTRFVAIRSQRGERRRQRREEKAGVMLEPIPNPSSSVDWERLGPVLDEALHALKQRDRELVLLRFFQNHSYDEMSAKLGLSADAARFRLVRALEKMRRQLATRGLVSTSAALALALAAQAQAAVPLGMAQTMAGLALAAKAPAATALRLSQIFMSTTKTKVAILAGAAVLGALLVQDLRQQSQLHRLRRQVLGLQNASVRLLAQVRSHPEINSGAQLAGVLSKMAQRPTRSPSMTGSSASALKPGMKPLAALTNAGQATPVAAVETLLWALNTGNVDLLAKMITFRPDARAAADKLWASLPAESHSQFPTPESMLAPVAAESFPSDLVGYQVTEDRQNGPTPDYWTVKFQYQKSDGTTIDTGASLQQINGNWLVYMSTSGIQKIANHLAGSEELPQL